MNLNIRQFIALLLVVIFCTSCGGDGSTDTGAATAAYAPPAAVATPEPEPEPVELIRNVVDDWGTNCPMQNSTSCGGYGVALVPGPPRGLACGPGTAVGQWVQNFEWVPC